MRPMKVIMEDKLNFVEKMEISEMTMLSDLMHMDSARWVPRSNIVLSVLDVFRNYVELTPP